MPPAPTRLRCPGPLWDNEDVLGVRLDRAFLRWQPGADGELSIGQDEFPLWLTAMVWDDDLRPIGVAYDHWWEFGSLHSVRRWGY